MTKKWPKWDTNTSARSASAKTVMPCGEQKEGTTTGVNAQAMAIEAGRQLMNRALAHLRTCEDCQRRARRGS